MEEATSSVEAVRKLNAIRDELKSGSLNVETLAAKVREAVRLIEVCRRKLYGDDLRVRQMLDGI